VAEGELDALCLNSILAPLGVAVMTTGSASSPIPSALRARLLTAWPVFAAHDADPAGEKAAADHWHNARRLRPPEGAGDWCDAYRADPSGLARHLAEALGLPDLTGLRHRLRVQRPGMLADAECRAEWEAIAAEGADG
jgi:hypothetical protein